jgi:hypothetical protein
MRQDKAQVIHKENRITTELEEPVMITAADNQASP